MPASFQSHPPPHPLSDIAQACGLDDPSALFLPFSNPLVNDPPAIPALIEREMLARHTALNAAEPEASLQGGLCGARE